MNRASATDWTVLRRRFSRRTLLRLLGFLLVAFSITCFTWMLFATEPARLDDGSANPASRATPFVGATATLGLVTAAGAALRPPRLAVNHYGVAVRPGPFRTVLLPWTHVEEVTAVTVAGRRSGEPYLLFAIDEYCGDHAGTRPRFLDRAVLREANRASEGRLSGFDVAVRLSEFEPSPRRAAAMVARYAPASVSVVNQLDHAMGPRE